MTVVVVLLLRQCCWRWRWRSWHSGAGGPAGNCDCGGHDGGGALALKVVVERVLAMAMKTVVVHGCTFRDGDSTHLVQPSTIICSMSNTATWSTNTPTIGIILAACTTSSAWGITATTTLPANDHHHNLLSRPPPLMPGQPTAKHRGLQRHQHHHLGHRRDHHHPPPSCPQSPSPS